MGSSSSGGFEVRDVHKLKFSVLAFSRNVVSPPGHDLGLPAWPRTPDDDTDFNHDSPLLEKPIRVRRRDSL